MFVDGVPFLVSLSTLGLVAATELKSRAVLKRPWKKMRRFTAVKGVRSGSMGQVNDETRCFHLFPVAKKTSK
jgi:hypothetical protein